MQVLTNHVGYETDGPKRAVVKADRAEAAAASLPYRVRDAASGKPLLSGEAVRCGAVQRWKDWVFWTLDLSALRRPGRYVVELAGPGGPILSEPFEVGDRLLLRRTAPAVLRYFRSQRCHGIWDEADRRAGFYGGRTERVDVHGGWYDASGDRSKYLSHLSYAEYLNPQQSPLAVWAFLAAAELLAGLGRSAAALRRELLEEAAYGAEFLVRMQDPEGYFYQVVFDRWTKDPACRQICVFRGQEGVLGTEYHAAYREGGGLAIAALARAAAVLPAEGVPAEGVPTGAADWDACRRAALRGFAHLEAHNREYVQGGRENILDDYCALLAASELAAAGGGDEHREAARARAARLAGRLSRDRLCTDFWRADARGERPFFHAAEAGLPVIALLRYAEIEPDPARAAAAREAARRSLEFELSVTGEVVNPFGLARQYVKPVDGPPRTAFFFPHHNESGYWWQGENARLASLAAAALLARSRLAEEGGLGARLAAYAADQLDWILGRNPYDTCFLHGFGRRNPEYETRNPNAHGGICNGVTAGFEDEQDIDFLPEPHASQGAHRWRWSEQWLPHAAWYLLAVCCPP